MIFDIRLPPLAIIVLPAVRLTAWEVGQSFHVDK